MRAQSLNRLLLHTLLLFCLATLASPGVSGQSLPSGAGQAVTAFPGSTNAPDFLPVAEAYRLAVEIEDSGNLRLYWQIADSYYLYRHAFEFALSAGDTRIEVEARLPQGLDRSDEFFGDVSVYYDQADITLAPARPTGRAELTVTSQGCADAGLCYPPRTQQFKLDFTNATVTETTTPQTRRQVPDTGRATTGNATLATLLYMLLLAFAGGIILNLMPCVFPILSLKVFAFARAEPRERHRHGWWYTGGVIASFLLVAAVLVGLQQAGRAIGWGFQLQSPGFVIALAYLFIAMGLSLSGLVHFGGNLMNLGSGLAHRG
ncbi:MAG: protein-disulfide reductase DsbD family protein, partial [Chromatocurvus sp.]